MNDFDEEDIRFLGDGNPAAVMNCLRLLPEDVFEFVQRNVVFLSPASIRGQAMVFRLHPGLFGRIFVATENGPAVADDMFCVRLVYLDPSLMDEPEEVRDAIVAHEIAHCWLGHAEQPATSDGEFEEFEATADEMAIEWGFGEGIRMHLASGSTVRKVSDWNH